MSATTEAILGGFRTLRLNPSRGLRSLRREMEALQRQRLAELNRISREHRARQNGSPEGP